MVSSTPTVSPTEQVWKVFDIDGTREAARQRAFPQTPEQPVPHRRPREVCAPGSTGRKRGDIVRPRTTVLHAHSSQWLGSFGNPGNGASRKEVRRAVGVIQSSLRAHPFPEERALLRLDGLSGTRAVLADLLGFAFVMRGTDSRLLDRPAVQTRVRVPVDQPFSRLERDLIRTLSDCPEVTVGASGPLPPGGGDPSRWADTEPGWHRTRRARLRTVLDDAAAGRLSCI
jgi:hypothetical protein